MSRSRFSDESECGNDVLCSFVGLFGVDTLSLRVYCILLLAG